MSGFGCEFEEGVRKECAVADRDEFLLLFLKYEADLRGFLRSVVLDLHARDDLFQECALVLWRQFDQFDGRQSFGAWARGIAANKIKQRRREDVRFPVAFSPETIQSVLDAFDRTEVDAASRTEALAECMEELPPKSRQLVNLRYERNLACAEIANQTGRTLEAVYRALSRIREGLEECIRRKLAVA
jgi:RNA polymerase sigma-70 factor (ECF subfamily)